MDIKKIFASVGVLLVSGIGIFIALHSAYQEIPAHLQQVGNVLVASQTVLTARSDLGIRGPTSVSPHVRIPLNAHISTTRLAMSSSAPKIPEQKRLYEFVSDKSETVLEAMNEHAAAHQFEFKTREFPGLGVMIESINGLENADGYYWILYINWKNSEKGVSSARVTLGDSIEWKYEKGY